MSLPTHATTDEYDELHARLSARRSVRRFRATPVPRELLQRVLEAAILAPSASNQQPWRFFVVTSAARRAALASAVRKVVNQIVEHVPPESQATFAAYGDYFTRFEDAPVVIAPLCRGLPLLGHLIDPFTPPELRARIVHVEAHSGVVGTSLALQNLLLAASSLGLGASLMSGPLLAEPELRELLQVPRAWSLVGLVPLGFPDEEPRATERKALAHVVRFLDDEPDES
jgi:nitroreductase